MKSEKNAQEPESDVRKVKLMVFVPSNRRIWTFVGKDHEYWVDPKAPFCSCNDFYFSTLSGGDLCYHLQAVTAVAKDTNLEGDNSKGFQKFEFIDQEYSLVIKALLSDAEKILRY